MRLKKYSMFLDILLGLNFFCVMAAALGAAISDGDIKLTVILGALNVTAILICRLSDKGVKKNDISDHRR